MEYGIEMELSLFKVASELRRDSLQFTGDSLQYIHRRPGESYENLSWGIVKILVSSEATD